MASALDPSLLPKFNPAWAPDSNNNDNASTPSPIRAGLGAGFHQLVGLGGSALQGTGTLLGLPGLAQAGENFANDQNATAERVGRPDLEGLPQSFSSLPAWLEYQGAKLIPTLAGYTAATLAVPEAAVPAGLARLGATLPEFLGGAGLEAGAGYAARKAALAAGTNFGKFVIGGGAFGATTGFGQGIQSAAQAPGGVNASSAGQAALEAPLYGAAGLLEPGFLRNAIGGAEGSLAARVIARGLSGTAVGAVQSGAMAALDQTFRPDLTTQQKMQNVVDAAVTGAAVGGTFGGITGIRALRRVDPADLANNPTAIDQAVDEALDLGQAGQNIGRVALPAPAAFTDSAGRTALGTAGDQDLRATPRESAPEPEIPQAAPALFSPADVPDRSAVPGSIIAVGRRGEGGRFTSEPTGVEQPPVVPEDTSRSYRNRTTPELISAGNALANKAEAAGAWTPQQLDMAKSIHDELAFRRGQQDSGNATLTADVVNPGSVEAVSASANRRGTGEQNSAAPASASTDTVKSYIADITNGLRLPSGLKEKLADATSVEDVQNIVHDESIIQAKGGKVRDTLAQRVGVLDDEGRPTQLATEIDSRKAAAEGQAPVAANDTDFSTQWKQDVKQIGQKDPAVQALTPKSEADAQLQIYRALGDQGVKSDADGLERLAQKYGVLDDQKRLTPRAVELAQRDPIPTEDTVQAAQAQGFKGSQASMFERGTRAYTGEATELTSFANKDNAAAYEAGVKFAEETNSVPKGALTKYEPAPLHTVTDEQRALGQPVEVRQSTIPAEVKQGQLVNHAIDNAGLSPTKDESDIAALKRMVREGNIKGAMDGLRAVRRGESLFEQPERKAAEPFAGEKITPGAPRSASGPDLVPTRATTRAQAERAIRTYELGKMIDAAHAEGSVSNVDRLRLVNQLRQGRLGDVIKAVGQPTGKIEGPVAAAGTRAARRADLHQSLQEAFAQQTRENEVPELNVDSSGVLKPYININGAAGVTAGDRAHAADLIGTIIDNEGGDPKAILDKMIAQGGTVGEAAARFGKYLPEGLSIRALTRDEMAEVAKQEGYPRTPWGLYDHGSNQVLISTSAPHPSVVMHELAHAIIGSNISDRTPVGRQIQSAFERFQKYGPKDDYAFKNADEFMAEFLSRQQVRDYVRDIAEQHPDAQGNIFQRIWNAIRKTLGMPPKDQVEKLLDLAEQAGGTRLGPGRSDISPLLTPSPELNDRARDAVKDVGGAISHFMDRADLKGKLLGTQLYWADRHHITEMFAKWFQRPDKTNPMRDVELHERQRVAINAKLTQPSNDVIDRYNKVLNADRKSGENVQRIMQSTEFPFDYSKSWKNQSDEVRAMSRLQTLHQQYHDMWRGLSPDAKQVLSDFRALNDVQMLQYRSLVLHAEALADPTVASALGLTIHETPVDRYLGEPATLGPAETRAWWLKQVGDQSTALANHIAGELHGQDKDTVAAKTAQYKGIGDAIKDTQEAVAKIESKPYFHLPRFGQFFVDWKVRDHEALSHIADQLEGKGFNGIISKDSDQNHVFMRLENAAQQKALAEIIDGFRGGKDALVTEASTGRLSDEKYSASLLNRGLDRLIQTIQNNSAFDDKARETAVAGLRKTILDLMPENAISRVMTHRDNIPGYNSDMIRGFAQRYRVGVDSLSNTVVSPKIAQAYTEMRGMIRDAEKAPLAQVSVDQRDNMQRVVDELSRRQREMSEWGHNKYLDLLSRITSAHYLGLSPAFGFVQLSQVGVVTLPELGSEHGFVRSAREIAKATPLAFKIMRQVFAEGKKISLTRAMDAVVTRDALIHTPGVSARMADFLMNIVGSGHVDLGGQIRELVRQAEATDKQGFDKAMRYATSIGYYSETMSRLIAAIATHNLNPTDMPVERVADKARHVLDESLFNFSPENWGRAFGKKGFLGAATPLATKFMQYTAQLTGKLYREAHSAMGGDKQAQRFLVQHLGAMTVLAGTLGLPLVSAFAAAYDKLKDEFADEGAAPSDIRSDFREYMTHVFGSGIEPVIDKGLARAAGIDVSQRLGEQDIMPFSRFFADRRNIKDSLSDLESRSWGAPTAMIIAYAEGISKISQGDLLGGMSAALPLGLANPVKAYRMANGQMIDAKGDVLPIEPSTRDVIVQALGFNPGQKADYSDRLSAAKTSDMILSRRAASLRNQMVEAMTNRDTGAMQQLAQKIAEFDRANPLRTPVSSSIAAAYQSRIKQNVVAARTQQPLGVRPGMGRYSYGDIQFEPALGNQAQ